MRKFTIRNAATDDRADLERLAALDSGSPPRGPALVAEADSRIFAALPLGSGRPIADPFERTSEVVALLQLRAAQLERRESASPGLVERARSLFRAPARA